MPQTPWNLSLTKQCEEEVGQVVLRDEHSLAAVNQDFGQLVQGQAVAVFKPTTLNRLQQFLQFAAKNNAAVTIHSKGLSQSGQSLAVSEGICLDVSELNKQLQWNKDRLISGCNVSWREIISQSLKKNRLPLVFPHNCNLTLGGVLSVGGLGASSFKEGVIGAHINALKVITASGDLVECSKSLHADLFNACLSGLGLFAVIFAAELNLRPCKAMVRTLSLDYKNYEDWIADQFRLRDFCDYLEAVVLVKTQDAAVYKINLAIEYEQSVDLNFLKQLQFNQLAETEDKTIEDYVYRHDPRLNHMKESGAWEAFHPWYECYVDSNKLAKVIDEVLPILDDSLGGIYSIFPVFRKLPKYFMFPEGERIVTFNVLTAGILQEQLPKALEALQQLDRILLNIGGKRYVSGWFAKPTESYWSAHYGKLFAERQTIKTKYDPNSIFCSQLFPNY